MYKFIFSLVFIFLVNNSYSQLKYDQTEVEIGLSFNTKEPYVSFLYFGGTFHNFYLEFQTNAFTKKFGDDNFIDTRIASIGAILPMYQSGYLRYNITPKIGILSLNTNTYFCGGLNFNIIYRSIKFSILTTFVKEESLLGFGLGIVL